MRVTWSQCITMDPDIPPEFAVTDMAGDTLGVVHHGFETRLVVMCDDDRVREVSIHRVRRERREESK